MENQLKILGNNIRMSILSLLSEHKGTISQLHKYTNKFLNENYDYKAVYKQVKILEKKGYVKLSKEKKKQGKPVYVELSSQEVKDLINQASKLFDSKHKIK